MAQLRDVAILVLFFATVTAVLLKSTEAEDYTVGGSIGWTSFPPGGASFYSKWAANLTFKVNDNLVFDFESGRHSVAVLTKSNYDKCNVNDNIKSLATGPARITLNHTGEFYFSCTFSGHCTSGQKLRVKVTGSSSPPVTGKALAEGPSSPASPSSSPSNEGPPPQGSAMSLPSISCLQYFVSILGHLIILMM